MSAPTILVPAATTDSLAATAVSRRHRGGHGAAAPGAAELSLDDLHPTVPETLPSEAATGSSLSPEAALEASYTAVRKLLLRMRSDMDRIESVSRGRGFRGDASSSTRPLMNELMVDINTLTRRTAELDPLLGPIPPRSRQMWEIKIRQLVGECRALRERIDSLLRRQNADVLEREARSQLLGGVFGGGAAGSRSTEQGQLSAESDSLARSNYMLQEMEAMGSATIANLIGQNETVKRAHRTVLDIGNSLGVSRSLMRMIERRQFFDRMLAYGGMLLVTTVIFVMWWYF